MNSRRSWIVFVGAVLAYLFSVTQRSSFGVAGVEAADRFDVNALALSSIAIAQIITYAALQIPVGVLVDRVGPRLVLALGAIVMAGGQALLAFSADLPIAVVARVLVGAGDAVTFVSIARLLPNWFQGPILPQLLQWVGMVGQLGQLVSAIPFTFALHALGWTPAFAALSGLALASLLVIIAMVRTGTPPPLTGPMPTGSTWSRLLIGVRRSGTQLGFWSHMLGGTAPNMMVILWAQPFLVAGLGLDVGTTALVLSMISIGALAGGPVVGWLIAHYPLRRSDLVLGIATAVYSVWALVLVLPGTPPVPLVAVLYFLIGIGGPGSLIGFDIARSLNSRHILGSVSGVVNVGGFLGAFVAMFVVGLGLDLADVLFGLGTYSLASFRVAFLGVFVIAGISAVGVLVTRHRTRRDLFAEEGISIAPVWVALFRARRRRPR